MSTRIIRELIDDLDGGPAAETVSFGLNGATYEIDLSDVNVKKLHDFLEPFVQNGRRQPRGAAAPQPRRTASTGQLPAAAPAAATPARETGNYPRVSREQNKAIREWATKNGHDVPARGRIPKHVLVAFNAAH